jgi:hypothetical protein
MTYAQQGSHLSIRARNFNARLQIRHQHVMEITGLECARLTTIQCIETLTSVNQSQLVPLAGALQRSLAPYVTVVPLYTRPLTVTDGTGSRVLVLNDTYICVLGSGPNAWRTPYGHWPLLPPLKTISLLTATALANFSR